jgi:hypothetical protein
MSNIIISDLSIAKEESNTSDKKLQDLTKQESASVLGGQQMRLRYPGFDYDFFVPDTKR